MFPSDVAQTAASYEAGRQELLYGDTLGGIGGRCQFLLPMGVALARAAQAGQPADFVAAPGWCELTAPEKQAVRVCHAVLTGGAARLVEAMSRYPADARAFFDLEGWRREHAGHAVSRHLLDAPEARRTDRIPPAHREPRGLPSFALVAWIVLRHLHRARKCPAAVLPVRRGA